MSILKSLAAVLLACASTVWAQADYPRQPIRMVVGFASGGISDVLARAIAAKMSVNLGQQVVVENKPGTHIGIADISP